MIAGMVREEYEAAGISFDAAGRRVGRLEESLAILRSLLAGRKTTFAGDHYRIDGLTVFPRPARRPRIVVGAGSGRMLGIAARHADTVGILPRALPEGKISEKLGERRPDTVARKADLVCEAAGDRDVELSMMVTPTFGPDPRRTAARVAGRRGWGDVRRGSRPRHAVTARGPARAHRRAAARASRALRRHLLPGPGRGHGGVRRRHRAARRPTADGRRPNGDPPASS